MNRFAVSISRTSRTTLSAVGSAPPANDVSAPRGITGTRRLWQILIAAATALVGRGRTTASRGPRYAVKRVAFICLCFLRVGDDRVRGQDGTHRGDDLGLMGDDRGVGNGHGDAGHWLN